jgi:hypothetical protein
LNLPRKNDVPSVGPGGDAWLNQTNKNKNAFNKKFGMDANLGVMTVRRQSRRKASSITRWSHSARKDIGSNREPLATVSSYGSEIHSRLANDAPSKQKTMC